MCMCVWGGWGVEGGEGILIGALGADWALRLASERPADYVRLRAESKPAQPLNFTAFGSYSRSSAHFRARCSNDEPPKERERERAKEKENRKEREGKRAPGKKKKINKTLFLRLLQN